MAVVVRLEDLIGVSGILTRDAADDAFVVESTGDPREDDKAVRKLWGLVLMMAVRDRASAVHYHPWRDDGGLAYVVDNVRYHIVPPPPEWAGHVVAAARSLFIRAGRGWPFSRRGAPACGSFELEVGGNRTAWDAVVWSTGARGGVELLRVAPEAGPAIPPG